MLERLLMDNSRYPWTAPFRYHAVPHRFPSMVVARARKYPITCCCCSVAVP